MRQAELKYESTGDFYYRGDDLGVVCKNNKTGFKLWAPGAAGVEVIIYCEETEKNIRAIIPLVPGDNGCWQAEIDKNLAGYYYLFRIDTGKQYRMTVDPYARCVGTNSELGLIVDLEETDPEGWERDRRVQLASPADAVIYELHVRDFSSSPHSGIVHKGKYIGFLEENTENQQGFSTGLAHLQELGITHVHLLPIFDFASVNDLGNEYNWGYDPYFYNSPEGSYSIDPAGSTRIRELKMMVQALHRRGIGVIMDVVYNHTYHTRFSPFQLTVPDYYYRWTECGGRANGSGCGNEIATERPMMRKFIVDSVSYWAEEYHIDGFRFDLMGLIDRETMTRVEEALHEIDPSILIYGEPWSALPPQLDPARVMRKGRQQGRKIAVFNDNFRNAIKGDNDGSGRGFVSGARHRVEAIKKGVVGGINDFALRPVESVNYVSSHDNLTLWDKLARSNGADSEEMRIKMDRLAQAIVFTSQGIPFMQGGEEFLRTKYGGHNTYNAGDRINQLKWERKSRYYDTFNYYRGLIKLRREHPAFRLRTACQVRKYLHFLDGPGGTVGFSLNDYANNDSWKTIIVLYNPHRSWQRFVLDNRQWQIVVDDRKAGITPFNTFTADNVKVPPVSAMVLFSNE